MKQQGEKTPESLYINGGGWKYKVSAGPSYPGGRFQRFSIHCWNTRPPGGVREEEEQLGESGAYNAGGGEGSEERRGLHKHTHRRDQRTIEGKETSPVTLET